MALGEVVGSYLPHPPPHHPCITPLHDTHDIRRARFTADSISGRMALGEVVGSYLLSKVE
jgi:hypothetical protein